MLAIEHDCVAKGDAECAFLALDASQWDATPGQDVQEALLCLPFQPLRDVVQRSMEDEPAPDLGDFQEGTPVVHVWGPVMVVPFSGPDESLRALELIGRDPCFDRLRAASQVLEGAPSGG